MWNKCPKCGYCPCCGRSNDGQRQVFPRPPRPWMELFHHNAIGGPYTPAEPPEFTHIKNELLGNQPLGGNA